MTYSSENENMTADNCCSMRCDILRLPSDISLFEIQFHKYREGKSYF